MSSFSLFGPCGAERGLCEAWLASAVESREGDGDNVTAPEAISLICSLLTGIVCQTEGVWGGGWGGGCLCWGWTFPYVFVRVCKTLPRMFAPGLNAGGLSGLSGMMCDFE